MRTNNQLERILLGGFMLLSLLSLGKATYENVMKYVVREPSRAENTFEFPLFVPVPRKHRKKEKEDKETLYKEVKYLMV